MEQKIKNRFEKVENRVEKLEKTIFDEGLSKKGKLVKCKCGHSWITKSKSLLVSCSNCGLKVRTKEKEKVTCFKCKKKLKKENSKFGYSHYFCKKCFKEYDKDAREEVDKMVSEAEKKGTL